MASIRTCDGCGSHETEETPLKELGLFLKRDYCLSCQVVIGDFIAARDALHDGVAKTWREGLAGLIASTLGAHPAMRLPDVE